MKDEIEMFDKKKPELESGFRCHPQALMQGTRPIDPFNAYAYAHQDKRHQPNAFNEDRTNQPSERSALLLLRVLLNPCFRGLEELLSIFSILACNTLLHRVIWLRIYQQPPREFEDCVDLARRFPFVRPKKTETHGAFVIVGDIRVIDFRLEREGWRLEWILFR